MSTKIAIVFFASALLFLAGSVFAITVYPNVFSSQPDTSFVVSHPKFSEEKLWILVNNWKMQSSGYRYQKSETLCSFAEIRLEDISDDFSHNKFFARYSDLPYRVGENLSKGFYQEQEVLDNWLSSPAHLEILQDDFKSSCLKCKNFNCVQLFSSI